MTSLALLAHTTRAAAPPFNGLFYATAATIIPVLFLALAVQSTAFRGVVRAYMAWIRTLMAHSRPTTLTRSLLKKAPIQQAPSSIGGSFSGVLLISFLMNFLAFTVAAGAWGELLAVYALYQQQDRASTRSIVLFSTMFLIIAVVAAAIVLAFTGIISGQQSPRMRDGLARRRPPPSSIPPPFPKWAKRAYRG